MLKKWIRYDSSALSLRPLMTGLLVSLLLAFLFSAIAEDIANHDAWMRSDDQSVEGWLLSNITNITPAAVKISTDVSILGNATIISVVSLFLIGWWAWKKDWLLGGGLLASVFGGGALNFILKVLFQRPRPNFTNAPLHETDWGFPSGHAMISLLFFGFLAFVLIQNAHSMKWRWVIALFVGLIPLIVGFSRLLLGVHYPTDVLAGWLAGATWLAVCVSLSVTIRTNQIHIARPVRLEPGD